MKIVTLQLSADKDNVAIIMDTTVYQRKISELLANDAYQTISRDPTGRIEHRSANIINKPNLPLEGGKGCSLLCLASRPPRLYGVPKIHKTGIPLRPIVSTIGAPTYSLPKYLVRLLKPMVGGCVHVKDSIIFANTVDCLRVSPSDILVDCDVVSLFTKTPLDATL